MIRASKLSWWYWYFLVLLVPGQQKTHGKPWAFEVEHRGDQNGLYPLQPTEIRGFSLKSVADVADL